MKSSTKRRLNFLWVGLARNGLLKFVSDKTYVKVLYRIRMDCRLDLKNPRTFNEKLQWLKLYDRKEEYTDLVDKIAAKKKVGSIIGEEYIVPMYDFWEDAEDIDFSLLPDQFVLKCNHDQGSVVLVKYNKPVSRDEIVADLKEHLRRNNYDSTREYPYKNIKPMVFAEKYLGDDIIDYKFYCFMGEPKFLYTSQGLARDHLCKMAFFDMNWHSMPFGRTDYEQMLYTKPPEGFEKMKEIARRLAKGTTFVRIDLFEVNSHIYFSEFTLCPASGFMPFAPVKYDEIVGGWLDLGALKKKALR